MSNIPVTIVLMLSLATSFGFFLGNPVRSFHDDRDVSDGFVNESTITYELFTRKNPILPHLLTLGDPEALEKSDFNSTLPTKIFAHGWRGSPQSAYPSRDGYLEKENCNFIAVNWSELASGPLPYPSDYPYIVEVNVPKVGKNLGAFVDFIIEHTGAAISSFHLIGWSLGAHVVGNAGAAVTSGKLPRITGLDPAGPFFPLNDTSNRLDISDATFIDIIHTDSGDLGGNELGMEEPIGHVDFYPNGGANQPGCFHLGNDSSSFESRSNCDHARAPAFFAESITSDTGFWAVMCDSFESFLVGLCDDNPKALMGDPTPAATTGIFYLATNSEKPYALGLP